MEVVNSAKRPGCAAVYRLLEETPREVILKDRQGPRRDDGKDKVTLFVRKRGSAGGRGEYASMACFVPYSF